MGMIKAIKSWLFSGQGKAVAGPSQRDVDASLTITLSSGRKEIALIIPSDEEFHQRGWIVGDWFNQQTLAMALAAQSGMTTSRQVLQKVAYEVTRPSHSVAQQAWFRDCMAQFVRVDPVYQDNIDRICEHIRQHPGIVQSEIYGGQDESHKEAARYILYFANELGDIRREKAGRSYKLYIPEVPENEKAEYQQVGETQLIAGGAFSAKVMVKKPTEREQKISSLHKQATAEQDFSRAVEYLREAQKLMPTVNVDYGIERYLRLPNYLQQAGHMDEAKTIFNELLDERWEGHEKSAIHNQMRIAYNREKEHHRACLHGVQSILWRCLAYLEQDRLPIEWKSAEFWSKDIAKLLKRSKRLELLEDVLERLAPFFADPRRDTIGNTIDAVQELIDHR